MELFTEVEFNENEFIESIVFPKREDDFEVDDAFGIFAGYGIAITDDDKKLPKLSKDQSLSLKDLKMEQHFTQPPPRFSESSLVRELEENGIGRPSTYSSIISTIQDREYVIREKRKLKPTVLGKSVNDMLIDGFPEILDVKFTADMEDKLPVAQVL